MEKVLKSPLFWMILIMGALRMMYVEPDLKPYEGTYAPYPITQRSLRQDSLAQLRAKNAQAHGHRQGAHKKIIYEAEAYIDGKWVKIQQIRINEPEPEYIDYDLIYDQFEGK